MSCASRCFEIGGPWITYDPVKDSHGDEARLRERLSLEDRITLSRKDIEDEIKYLKRRNKELQDEIDKLKAEINYSKNKPCPICRSGVYCRVHEGDY